MNDSTTLIMVNFIFLMMGVVIGFFLVFGLKEKFIKEDMLKFNKYRLNDFYVINGSIDKDIKNE